MTDKIKVPLPEWLGEDTPENRERLQAFVEGRLSSPAKEFARLKVIEREAAQLVRYLRTLCKDLEKDKHQSIVANTVYRTFAPWIAQWSEELFSLPWHDPLPSGGLVRTGDVLSEKRLRTLVGADDVDHADALPDVIATHSGEWRKEGSTQWRWYQDPEVEL